MPECALGPSAPIDEAYKACEPLRVVIPDGSIDCREILGVDVVHCGNHTGASKAVFRNAPSYLTSIRSEGSIMRWETVLSTHIFLEVSTVTLEPPATPRILRLHHFSVWSGISQKNLILIQ